MDCCGKKRILMVMTSACSCAAFGLLCIAVATDYWLYTKEKVSERTYNRSAEYLRMYSGLWRTCVEAARDRRQPTCTYINYFTKNVDRDERKPTEAILYSMRRSTFFPLSSLLILLIGGIICFVGHCHTQKKVLTFVSGIFFVLAGLCTLVGIILYIGSITGEVGNKPRQSLGDPIFVYSYGSSFMMAVGSFALTELSGVLCVYLFISRHKHEKRKIQQRVHMVDSNERPAPAYGRYRRSRSQSRDRSQSRSRDPSMTRSESYFTYTPMSDTSREMSNYTFPRDSSRNTISTTAETHIPKDHSIHSVDTLRRTTPV